MQDRVDFMKQMASTENQPRRMMQALEDLVNKVIGTKLMTLMRTDLQRGETKRTYSSRPGDFPTDSPNVSGTLAWRQHVLDRRETILANNLTEMQVYFSDVSRLQDAGCESCLILPVVVHGRLLGVMNCLHEAGHMTPDKAIAAESLKLPAAIALMAGLELDDDAYSTKS